MQAQWHIRLQVPPHALHHPYVVGRGRVVVLVVVMVVLQLQLEPQVWPNAGVFVRLPKFPYVLNLRTEFLFQIGVRKFQYAGFGAQALGDGPSSSSSTSSAASRLTLPRPPTAARPATQASKEACSSGAGGMGSFPPKNPTLYENCTIPHTQPPTINVMKMS